MSSVTVRGIGSGLGDVPGRAGARLQTTWVTVGQVAWRLGVSPQEYRELEAGTGLPSFQTWDATCKLYGWSQSFVLSVPANRLSGDGEVSEDTG